MRQKLALRRFEKEKKLWTASPPKRMLDAAGFLGSDDDRPPPFNLEQLRSQVGIHGTLDHNLEYNSEHQDKCVHAPDCVVLRLRCSLAG